VIAKEAGRATETQTLGEKKSKEPKIFIAAVEENSLELEESKPNLLTLVKADRERATPPKIAV